MTGKCPDCGRPSGGGLCSECIYKTVQGGKDADEAEKKEAEKKRRK